MKKVLVAALIIAMLSLLFVGCGTTTTTTPAGTTAATTTAATTTAAGEKIKLGFAFDNFTNEYNTHLQDYINAYLKDNNLESTVEIIWTDAKSDPVKQNEQVDTLITQGVKAIVMVAGNAEAQVSANEAAQKAGIPMIELCASSNAKDIRTSYVGSEDYVSGVMLATYLFDTAKANGTGFKIIELHGPSGHTAALRRHDGLIDTMAKYPGTEIVATKICNWSREEALTAMENVIQSNLEFNIVWAANDEMAMGGLNALKNSGKDISKIIIGGVDAIPDALQAVKAGELNCTVFQDAKSQGEKALEVAILAAKGETIDPLYDIPYILVTKENVDDFIK